MQALLKRIRGSRPLRAWQRYGDAHGNILAGGIGYFAFFSIFPAVALAFTVFGVVLHGHPELLDAVTSSLRRQLPGMIKDPNNPAAGGIISAGPPGATALTITGIVSFVGLVLAGLGWLGSMRTGIRAVFGAPGSTGNFVTNKLRDLGVMLTLGLGIALSGVFTSIASGLIGRIADLVGLPGAPWLIQGAVLVISVLADTGLMLLLLRVLSGVDAPWRALLPGAVIGGVGLTLIKVFAGQLIAHATKNPLLASLGIVVGLLFLLNLMSRLTLLSAAWAANDVAGAGTTASMAPGASSKAVVDAEPGPDVGSEVQPEVEPQAEPNVQTVAVPSRYPAGSRSMVAVGAVLGATSVITARVLGHVMRALARRSSHR